MSCSPFATGHRETPSFVLLKCAGALDVWTSLGCLYVVPGRIRITKAEKRLNATGLGA